MWGWGGGRRDQIVGRGRERADCLGLRRLYLDLLFVANSFDSGGLITREEFEVRRLVYHSTLGWRAKTNKEKDQIIGRGRERADCLGLRRFDLDLPQVPVSEVQIRPVCRQIRTVCRL